jgi:Domain of unknown function (DUF3644)
LIKAREAMIAAVHMFNGAGLTFRAELFIVTCIIAWTYLMHAWFKREGIDYRYKKNGTVVKTKEGADRYWELGHCIRHHKSPLKTGAVRNLEFLLGIRHEIEHRSTSRIDDLISAKLQACCLNFNDAIKSMFGGRFGLERRLPIALQFVTFAADQRNALKMASSLPTHVETCIDAFEHGLSEAELSDPAYHYRVKFVPILSGASSKADMTIEFVAPDSEEGQQINKVVLKEVDKARYTATQILERMKADGFPKFTTNAHTKLWQELDAKKPGANYGKEGDYKGQWSGTTAGLSACGPTARRRATSTSRWAITTSPSSERQINSLIGSRTDDGRRCKTALGPYPRGRASMDTLLAGTRRRLHRQLAGSACSARHCA